MVTSLSEKVELQQKEIDSLKKRLNDLENQSQNNNQIKNGKPFNINISIQIIIQIMFLNQKFIILVKKNVLI